MVSGQGVVGHQERRGSVWEGGFVVDCVDSERGWGRGRASGGEGSCRGGLETNQFGEFFLIFFWDFDFWD